MDSNFGPVLRSFQDFYQMLSILIAALIGYLFQSYSHKKNKQRNAQPHQERLSILLENLKRSSLEFGTILHEMSETASDRERALNKLEADLANLERMEKDVKERVENLRNIPLPAAKHILDLLEPEGKRSARRDYILFAAGVIVSTLTSVIFEYKSSIIEYLNKIWI